MAWYSRNYDIPEMYASSALRTFKTDYQFETSSRNFNSYIASHDIFMEAAGTGQT